MHEVAVTVGRASVDAAGLLPTSLDASCITSDFSELADDLFTTWKSESRTATRYLAEFSIDLKGIAAQMAKAEEELAREARKP